VSLQYSRGFEALSQPVAIPSCRLDLIEIGLLKLE
jgi:hypothetical protein